MRILLLVMIGVLLSELALNLSESTLSMNAARISQYNDRLQRSENSILVLGNSLSGEAFGGAPEFTALVPDGTSIYDWLFIVKNKRVLLDRYETIIIGFAWGQLSDQESPSMERLGGYFASPDDLTILNSLTEVSLDENANFILAHYSKLWLYKSKIREGLLQRLVPNYQIVAQNINDARRGSQRKTTESPFLSYTALAELLLQLGNRRVILVAMPVKDRYELDPQILEFVRERQNVEFLDWRSKMSIGGLGETVAFKDSIHASQQGALYLTAEIRKYLSENQNQEWESGGR